jgi:predicted DNA-binding ArsR family transcriptional regulator
MRREDRLREFMVVGQWYTVPEIEEATGIDKCDIRRALNSLKRFGMAEHGEIRDDGSRCREWRLIEEAEA